MLTATEFGRTAAENGTTGTDHGWGSCILAASGLVQTVFGLSALQVQDGVLKHTPHALTQTLFKT